MTVRIGDEDYYAVVLSDDSWSVERDGTERCKHTDGEKVLYEGPTAQCPNGPSHNVLAPWVYEAVGVEMSPEAHESYHGLAQRAGVDRETE